MLPSVGVYRGIALGQMHLSRRDFYEMRLGEFWEALNAFRNERDADMQHIGELVRGATVRLWNLHASEKSRVTNVSKFWGMPWDEEFNEEDEVRRLMNLTDTERDAAVEAFFNNIKGD